MMAFIRSRTEAPVLDEESVLQCTVQRPMSDGMPKRTARKPAREHSSAWPGDSRNGWPAYATELAATEAITARVTARKPSRPGGLLAHPGPGPGSERRSTSLRTVPHPPIDPPPSPIRFLDTRGTLV